MYIETKIHFSAQVAGSTILNSPRCFQNMDKSPPDEDFNALSDGRSMQNDIEAFHQLVEEMYALTYISWDQITLSQITLCETVNWVNPRSYLYFFCHDVLFSGYLCIFVYS